MCLQLHCIWLFIEMTPHPEHTKMQLFNDLHTIPVFNLEDQIIQLYGPHVALRPKLAHTWF